VVAHEELVVVDVVDVVGVHDAVLVGAGKRETVIGGAHVGAARVEGTQTGLSEGRASNTFVGRGLSDVAGTLLAGAEEAGTGGLTSAGLGARAPGRPLGHLAVDGAVLNVASEFFFEGAGLASRAGEREDLIALEAAVLGSDIDAAETALSAATAGLGAGVLLGPVGQLAVDRASLLAAIGCVNRDRARLSTKGRLGDGTDAPTRTLATSDTAC